MDRHVAPEPDAQPIFAEAEPVLLCLLAEDVQEGLGLGPSLLAFAGERALGMVRLRPHEPGEVVKALLEVLALLLPLGADRIALALPGRAWSTEDPIAPVTDEVDLRQPVVVTTVADAHGHPCVVRARIHPFEVDEDGRCWWQPAVEPEDELDAPVVTALRVLLNHRDEIGEGTEPGAQVVAQFGRVLLLGHDVSLAPRTAGVLVAASASGR